MSHREVSHETIQAIVRYDAEELERVGEMDSTARVVAEGGVYAITLEDVKVLLDRLEQQRVSALDLYLNWFDPLDSTLKRCSDFAQLLSAGRQVEGETSTPQETAGLVLALLADAARACVQSGEPAAQWVEPARLREVIDCYEQNRELPREQWRCPEVLRERLVLSLAGRLLRPGSAEPLDEQSLAQFRTGVNDLCARGNASALWVRAQCCAGGNQAFACDWVSCARDLQRLRALRPDDGRVAGMLGEICYRGLGLDQPDYPKAFACFAVGAAAGEEHSLCRLGDCFQHGRGVERAPGIAISLYRRLYRQSRQAFCRGENDTGFADAALRLGRAYLGGEGVCESAQTACVFLLQAREAIRLRRAQAERAGDDLVERNIDSALRETERMLLGSHAFRPGQEKVTWSVPLVLHRLMEEGDSLRMKVRARDGKKLRIVWEAARDAQGQKKGLLLTVPEFSSCARTDRVKCTLRGCRAYGILSGKDHFRFDEWQVNEQDGRLLVVFCRRGKQVAWFLGGHYTVKNPLSAEKRAKRSEVQSAAVVENEEQ